MRRIYITLGVLFLVCAATPALADVVQGKIQSMNTVGVNLALYNEQGQPYPNLLNLRVGEPKQLANVRTYDWVRADIKQNKKGFWEASSLTKIKTPKVSASGAPFAPVLAPSANLMDSLKSPQAQNVIRGGLGGAITGAIASGVSGGKAGKGALVGAGVGAVAGLLQNILGAPAPQPTQQYVQSTPQDYPSSQSRRLIRHYDKDGRLVSEEEIR
jgi:hypothetical protein